MDALTRYEFSFKNPFVPLTNVKAVLIIIVVGIIVYSNMLFNGFVWDDIDQIVNNPAVHTLSNIDSFFFGTNDISGSLIKVKAPYYRPLMATFFTIMHSMFGPSPFFSICFRLPCIY